MIRRGPFFCIHQALVFALQLSFMVCKLTSAARLVSSMLLFVDKSREKVIATLGIFQVGTILDCFLKALEHLGSFLEA